MKYFAVFNGIGILLFPASILLKNGLAGPALHDSQQRPTVYPSSSGVGRVCDGAE